MKKLKKGIVWLLLIVLTVSLLGFAGCGATPASSSAAPEASSAPAAAASSQAASVAASTPAGGSTGTVVVSSKAHTEQYILGEMLALLIENHSDLTVDRQLGLSGGGDILHAALVNGEIDMYAEYTGTGWLMILKHEPMEDQDQLFEELQKEYQEQFGLTWSGLYGFNNTYALTMRKEQADEEGFNTVSDIASHSELTFGANPDYYEREDGYPGLSEAYGFTFENLLEVDIALKFPALESGECDVINAFSTDAQLHLPQYKILEDDKNYFTSYYAATVVRTEILEQYPELVDILAMMDDQISEEEMIAMNYAVEVEEQDFETVAKDFLTDKGLI